MPIDLRRVGDCFGAIGHVEDRGVPFVVAINSFAGSEQFDDATVPEALALRPGCPLIRMDARGPESCLVTLIGLVEQYAPARCAAA